ncbi:hypothetical protein PENTCL1PPCAC_10733 [Pristionchus entomophagus]|uniref:Uncharacterized protein n=1 Tax=Pristionchus entomophagus TaxID=358040 RepID=A0AAV5T6V2_9BILA|nr:hypothetical protein PENTCL1PPCAC_10733 [Pristionchus entomophagus]
METNLSSSSHKSDDVSVHSDSIPNSGADPATSIDKSNAPTSLQRFGSLTENSKLVAELTEEKEALQLKVSQLTKEMGERKAESDAVKEEFERFKVSFSAKV